MKFRVSILFFSLLNKNLSLKGDRSRPLFVTDVAERESREEKRREFCARTRTSRLHRFLLIDIILKRAVCVGRTQIHYKLRIDDGFPPNKKKGKNYIIEPRVIFPNSEGRERYSNTTDNIIKNVHKLLLGVQTRRRSGSKRRERVHVLYSVREDLGRFSVLD